MLRLLPTLGLTWLPLVALALALTACHSESADLDARSARCATVLAVGSYPATPEEARRWRANGSSWTDREIREIYVCRALEIGRLDEGWRAMGRSPEERSRLAYERRRAARLSARAMLGDPEAVTELERRDLEVYGRPDGPSYEQLVEQAIEMGLFGAAVHEFIIASAQRTNESVNRSYGLPGGREPR